MKKIDYSKLFTKRKDGLYQKYVDGKYLYSKDPEELYKKWQAHLNGNEIITFKEIAEQWESDVREKITERTWNNYKPHYENIIDKYGLCVIDDISARDIQNDLQTYKARNFSATIIKTRKTIFTQILDKAVELNYIKYNPALSVKLPKNLKKTKRRAPMDNEIKIVLANRTIPFGFFPFFLLCTGVRKSEALALLKSDIDLKKREISITKTLTYIDNSNPSVKPPKSESGIRTIPIIETLYDPLVEYIKNINGEVLFPANKSNRNSGGGYMTERGYDVAWDKYCKATGLNITAHQLRHGTATLMFEAGVDVYTAKTILGHSNINTTMTIYTELREKQKIKSIEKFNSGILEYEKN